MPSDDIADDTVHSANNSAIPAFADGKPITFDNNDASIPAVLDSIGKWSTRTSRHASLIKHGVVNDGRCIIVDTISAVSFFTGTVAEEHAYSIMCARRLVRGAAVLSLSLARARTTGRGSWRSACAGSTG